MAEHGIAERVAAGAAFLDEHDPNWWRADVDQAIDLDTLSLISSEDCILGQRCPLETRDGEYSAYLCNGGRLAETEPYEELRIAAWAIGLGFQLPRFGVDDPSDPSSAYDELTAEWRKVITGRRAAVPRD